MTAEATLTSKGQTTIPKEIRQGLRMKTGDRMSTRSPLQHAAPSDSHVM